MKENIGADAPSLNTQKGMWHFWGINNPSKTKLTVVGCHKESTVHKILTEGWTTGLGPQTMEQILTHLEVLRNLSQVNGQYCFILMRHCLMFCLYALRNKNILIWERYFI